MPDSVELSESSQPRMGGSLAKVKGDGELMIKAGSFPATAYSVLGLVPNLLPIRTHLIFIFYQVCTHLTSSFTEEETEVQRD